MAIVYMFTLQKLADLCERDKRTSITSLENYNNLSYPEIRFLKCNI